MNVCIVGWYGTETLGDRAILDGIFEILHEVDCNLMVELGSLYPFFSERTIFEDRNAFLDSAPKIKINIFNTKDEMIYKKRIKDADVVIMGGGPLMDLEELFLIKKGFKYAKSIGIPCVLMGCGLGPLKKEKYKNIVEDIISCADAIWLRDYFSMELLNMTNKSKAKVLGDPAIVSVEKFKRKNTPNKKNYALVNLRNCKIDEYIETCNVSDQLFIKSLEYLSNKFKEILLVPMHTFGIGGDDRYILSKLTMALKKNNIDNVNVVHEPIDLYGMYELVLNAKATIGMRYHSVVFQTILNGNNFIFNYTGSKNGKIKGFLNMYDKENFYGNRVWNMQDEYKMDKLRCLVDEEYFDYQYSSIKENYIYSMKMVMKR